MRIGELGRRAGVSTRTLRYYEERGLLTPDRLPNGYRSFGEEHLEQVRRIRFLLAAGISTDTAREVLPCMVDDGAFLVPACEDLVAEFEREERRISGRIAELETARTALAGIIAAAAGERRPHRAGDEAAAAQGLRSKARAENPPVHPSGR